MYANVMGYLGGINWAILVARVCQLFPAALPAKLLRCFFRVMDKWKWPTPVLLCALVRHPRLSLKVTPIPHAFPHERGPPHSLLRHVATGVGPSEGCA